VADLLLDTDIFIDHLRGAYELKVGKNRIHYSVITRAELVAGTSATDLVSLLLSPFLEVPVDRRVAETGGHLHREFSVRLPDCLIAATAIEHQLALVTRNRKDFKKIRGLRLRPPS
jgi:hypothetical protein